jgi:hypothetical protein
MAPALRTTPRRRHIDKIVTIHSTLTVGTTLEATTVDGRTRHVGLMRELRMAALHAAGAAAREGPFVRTGRRRDANQPDGRSSQMLRGTELERGTNDAAASLADPPVHTKILPEVHERPADEHGRGQRHDQTSSQESILRRHFGFHGKGLGSFCSLSV